MSNEEKIASEGLVQISRCELAKRSSHLVRRGLNVLNMYLDPSKIRLLIVDDIAETRDNIRQLLAPAIDIIAVGEARNGEEAVRLYEELKPDVVSMNINMPDMDGITATGIICSKHKDAKIFMLSVIGEADYIRRAMEAGARGYITKPPTVWELVDTIRSLAGQLTPEREAKREATLQDYLDRMTELLLQTGLCSSKPGDNVRDEVRSMTLTVLCGLYGLRKGKLLQFLDESNLINTGNAIIDLRGADLTLIRLQGANLQSDNLSGANLQGADLRETLLDGANLSEANLSRANLMRASLRETVLRKAILHGAHLPWCNLQGAYLDKADLRNANLRRANLRFTNLHEADLNEVDLTGANVTDKQLASAKSLKGVTMPDGTKHY